MSVQNYRRNRRIRVNEVRLIDENGEQVGVVSTKDALERARRAGLDLVEVAPTARPPVCKILDWGKFNYEQNKKEKKGSGPKAKSGLKELRVRPAISDHDLSYRLKDGRKFCDEGNKVLVVCIFRGRQMAHPEHGYDVMKRVSTAMADVAKVEMPAKLMGKRMTMLMAPLPASQRRHIAKDRDRTDEKSPESDSETETPRASARPAGAGRSAAAASPASAVAGPPRRTKEEDEEPEEDKDEDDEDDDDADFDGDDEDDDDDEGGEDSDDL